jgi:hypothetical protein
LKNKPMAKTKAWLNRHKRIKAILAWKGLPVTFVVLFALTFITTVFLAVSTWVWDWYFADIIPDAVMKNKIALHAELRQLIALLGSGTFIAGVLTVSSLLIDDDGDGIPDKLQKGEDSNANQTKI